MQTTQTMLSKDNKPHIGIFGRRNCGKSSLINMLAGHEVAIVSDIAGTTTDPVRKSAEIIDVGPVVLIDTAGVDDCGELGAKRAAKSIEAISDIDLALVVIAENELGSFEEQLIDKLKGNSTPYIIVRNKIDIESTTPELREQISGMQATLAECSAAKQLGLQQLIGAIRDAMPDNIYTQPSMFEGLISKNDTVLLITPIDSEAPAGRLILPQVQAIRHILDAEAIAIVLKEDAAANYLAKTNTKPTLAVTDSQIFDKAAAMVPTDIPLTSFSILLSRIKGPFDLLLSGTKSIASLKDGDNVLLLESCTHHSNCEDIGRVKIPQWITDFTGKKLAFDISAGLSEIGKPIEDYALVIQCGGCVATRKQLHNRLRPAIDAHIPISNYGMAIAFMKGIFDRATECFASK